MGNLSLIDVCKSFGKTEVVHGVNCEIADGEFIVVLGPSGCGKSTVLRMIAGLERVTAGEIHIGGKNVNRLEPADRNIAMVFQNYALYPHMTVYDNMAYGLKNHGYSKSDIDKEVRYAADILELTPLLNRKPKALSGGQRQRVAMGRAIVRKPSVFLYDEPLSNLDAKLRVQMRFEIRKLHQRFKITTVYVTHDQVEAMTLADRLIVMNEGYFEQVGAPLTVYGRPNTVFTAGFIGSPAMNFIEADVNGDGSHIVVGNTYALPNPVANGLKPDQKRVLLGIRPEHFLKTTDDEAMFKFTADMPEALGADTLVHGRILYGNDGTGKAKGDAVTIRVPGVTSVKKGDVLPLTVLPEHLHLFDGGNGKRLE